MPKAPKIYRRVNPGQPIERHSADESGQGQRGGDGLYQSYRYCKFRERTKHRQRAIDEQRVHDIYQQLEQRSFTDYLCWLEDANPMCIDCLEEGKIKPGRVMDHDVPIEKGGSVWDTDNLKWRCDHHHNVKRATGDKK